MVQPRSREYEELPEDLRADLDAWRRGGQPLPASVRALILAAPASVSNVRLARRYRLQMRLISQLRREAGVITEGMRLCASLPGRRGWRGLSDARSEE